MAYQLRMQINRGATSNDRIAREAKWAMLVSIRCRELSHYYYSLNSGQTNSTVFTNRAREMEYKSSKFFGYSHGVLRCVEDMDHQYMCATHDLVHKAWEYGLRRDEMRLAKIHKDRGTPA